MSKDLRICLSFLQEAHAEEDKELGLVRCPQCQCLTTKEELAMFNGFCEDCREEQEGDYD